VRSIKKRCVMTNQYLFKLDAPEHGQARLACFLYFLIHAQHNRFFKGGVRG
jgi:hypothetical protein